jgi:GAF domain-containing protein
VPKSIRDVLEAFETVLAEEGVHAALAFLNARTSHRFTGIYRLDAPMLRNVRLFDRENPSLQIGADAPLRETYCSVVGASATPFTTADTRADERLREHPARESTLAYCGVPLRSAEGTTLGTLCHFDLVPRPVPDEVPVLEAAAPLILHALVREGAFPKAE